MRDLAQPIRTRRLLRRPIQSQPEQETLLEAFAAGVLALIVLPVLAYCLMVMLTAPQRIDKVTDTSDVHEVINGVEYRTYIAPMFSDQKARRYEVRP